MTLSGSQLPRPLAAARIDQVVRPGVMRQLRVYDGIRDESEHRAHVRLSSPQPATDLAMRAMQRARARRPEVLARIIAGESVEIADLRAVRTGDPNDVMLGHLERA